MNHQTILKMVFEELVSGLHLTNEKIPKTLCAACELGKFHRQPLKIGRTRATRIGELVHSNVEGPMPSPSIGQARYYVLFTDDFSGWRVIYFMKCKSEVHACFRLFIASLLSETGKTIRTLRSDNGGEYSGNDFKKFLTEKGIRHETSAANTPAQNGVAERSNRTLLDAARSILLAINLPSTLWAEAVGYVVYIRNRVLSSTIKMTPFEAWNGRKPDVSNIRTFGSRAFAR
jgi:transposase InsO family protein